MKLKSLGYAAFVAATALAFVIGSAASSEAKGKKKAAAPAPTYCTLEYKPVCAVDHGITHSFSNACWAAMAGAKVISQGECGAAKAVKSGGKKKAKKAMKAKPAAEKPAAAKPAAAKPAAATPAAKKPVEKK